MAKTSLKIDTVLGRQEDTDDRGPFLLSSVQGVEGVSAPYAYDVVLYRLLKDRDDDRKIVPDVDPTKLINTPVTIYMRGKTETYIVRHGIFQTFAKDTIDYQEPSRGKKRNSRVYRRASCPYSSGSTPRSCIASSRT